MVIDNGRRYLSRQRNSNHTSDARSLFDGQRNTHANWHTLGKAQCFVSDLLHPAQARKLCHHALQGNVSSRPPTDLHSRGRHRKTKYNCQLTCRVGVGPHYQSSRDRVSGCSCVSDQDHPVSRTAQVGPGPEVHGWRSLTPWFDMLLTSATGSLKMEGE